MCIFCERAKNQLAEGGLLTFAQKREAENCEKLRERRIKATILTGFLGAGKTTFLNFVLKSLGHGKRIGVVQNEFGSVSVDDQLMLVERTEAEVITMPNGCLCCRVRGDMVEALRRLAERGIGVSTETEDKDPNPGGPPLDSLLVECSGLSEVIPVAQTFFADPFVQGAFQLDGVICVCDAANFQEMEGGLGTAAGSAGPEVATLLREQLSISDVCLLNKCDLVDSAGRDRIAARIRELSPGIRVVPCRHGKVNLGQVLKLSSFSLDTALSLDAHFLDSQEPPVNINGHGHGHDDGHDERGRAGGHLHAHDSFGSVGLEVDAAIDVERLKEWLRGVVEKHGERLVRVKGVLRSAGSSPSRLTIVQGVGGHIDVGEVDAGDQALAVSGPGASSRLVFIGRLLDFALRAELRAGFLALAKDSERPDASRPPEAPEPPLPLRAAAAPEAPPAAASQAPQPSAAPVPAPDAEPACPAPTLQAMVMRAAAGSPEGAAGLTEPAEVFARCQSPINELD